MDGIAKLGRGNINWERHRCLDCEDRFAKASNLTSWRRHWMGRVVIKDGKLTAYVNQEEKPVLSGKLLGESKSGRIGVWGWDSYFANFRFTPAEG